MAVFTAVSQDDVHSLLEHYDLGTLLALRGITAGIENTNYFLDTTQGSYVLTLFEVLTAEQLPFYIELMHHLAGRGVPVPQPQTRHDGSRISTLHGKPTAIVTRLNGGYEPEPSPAHCTLTGQTLAHAHLAAQDFPLHQPNLRSLPWWQETAPRLMPFLNEDQATLLRQSLDEQAAFVAQGGLENLPSGPAHCDLFRDNVLFDGTFESPHMGGFIDFYFAGCDAWIFDVAVSVNDWCIQRSSGIFIRRRLSAWLSAYHATRPFTPAERAAWPLMLRAAALRFWISRLFDFYLPRPAQTLKPHDPRHFERILRLRTTQPAPLLPGDLT
ncbi:homoserine kinase [Castellaniella sp.]|uniref:homoserine kinase n=1 Tax=Castellaniella sp. TaxID=1955812 RepID=UPI003C75E71D